MDFGLFNLMTQRDPTKSQHEIFSETVEQVQAAEELGFGSGMVRGASFFKLLLVSLADRNGDPLGERD